MPVPAKPGAQVGIACQANRHAGEVGGVIRAENDAGTCVLNDPLQGATVADNHWTSAVHILKKLVRDGGLRVLEIVMWDQAHISCLHDLEARRERSPVFNADEMLGSSPARDAVHNLPLRTLYSYNDKQHVRDMLRYGRESTNCGIETPVWPDAANVAQGPTPRDHAFDPRRWRRQRGRHRGVVLRVGYDNDSFLGNPRAHESRGRFRYDYDESCTASSGTHFCTSQEVVW